MASDRRLHPLTLLFEIADSLRQLAIPFIVIFFVSRAQSNDRGFTGPMIVVAVSALIAIARYTSFTYRYDPSELVIRSGLFVRNERHIPYDRIQNIDAVQNLGHRLLGVVKVQVQTGAGTAPEATLSVLPVAALDEMRALVFSRRGVAPTGAADTTPSEGAAVVAGASASTSAASATASTSAAPRSVATAARGRTLLALPLRELVISGFIDNRGLVLILGAIGVLTQIDPLPELASDRIAAWIPGVTRTDFAVARLTDPRTMLLIAGAIATVLLFVRLMSTVWAAIRLYDYRLSRQGDDLRMEYGSFTRVSATIPVRRIQTIDIHETVLHRMLDRAALRVTTAGGGAGASGSAEREWLAPIIRREQLPALLDELHPGFVLDSVAWRGSHPRAFRRIARSSSAVALVLAGIAALFVGKWAITIGVVLVIRALIRARSHVRHLAWSSLPDGVIFRGGWLRRRTTLARFSRIQAVALSESLFDRRNAMATIAVDTAAAPLGMSYLAKADAAELKELVVARAAGTRFTW